VKEQRLRDEARESYVLTERRCNVIISEVEEIRTALEQSERARKMAESELHEATDRVNEIDTIPVKLENGISNISFYIKVFNK
jgi:predicted transcriptional regulator